MKQTQEIGLKNVQAVYSGPEGELWELVMGRQIHIGGMVSSMDLAGKAQIRPGSSGVDLCCCTGAGMRFLVRFRQAARMTGVDATAKVIDLGRQRCREEGMADKIALVQADACRTGLPGEQADFVWGEDAWCYVADKPALIHEAARLVPKGGVIAFTDWVEGKGLDDAQARRYMQFMKFPTIFSLADYTRELEANSCRVLHAEDTGRFAPYCDLYIKMLEMQLTSDALRIIGYDMNLMQVLGGELKFVRELAQAGKIAQGLFVGKKES
jgi:ubiquinone/menaquinone biosynthesis C-methylase UbiE